MGSCCSKTETETVGQRGGEVSSKNRNNEKQGHKLGGEDPVLTKEAVAQAAELRYAQQQTKTKQSEAKLAAMKKMSRLEKGL